MPKYYVERRSKNGRICTCVAVVTCEEYELPSVVGSLASSPDVWPLPHDMVAVPEEDVSEAYKKFVLSPGHQVCCATCNTTSGGCVKPEDAGWEKVEVVGEDRSVCARGFPPTTLYLGVCYKCANNK